MLLCRLDSITIIVKTECLRELVSPGARVPSLDAVESRAASLRCMPLQLAEK
jgi:hypothetical protein